MNTAINKNEFRPGFEFQVLDGAREWQNIKIHQNCADSLIKELKKIYAENPDDFRRVSEPVQINYHLSD